MRIRAGFAATLVLVVVLALGPAGTSAAPSVASSENAVVYWNGVAATAIAVGRAPASSAVLGGMVNGAIYDAVAAVEGGLEPFATGVTAPPGASVEAAVATAARDVLVARVPAQASTVETAYGLYMGSLPAEGKEAGRLVGAAAAAGMIALRFGDGFDAVLPFTQKLPLGPGVFEPIAPPPLGTVPGAPVDPKLALVRPFTHDSPSDYRPDGPLELTSKRYARDLAEVQAYGRLVSSVRTPLQLETVLFHTEQTFVQFSRTLRGLAVARGLDVRESARLLGYVNVATADTMLACFEAKYYYHFWRPNHAIQRADTDGNAATAPEANWLPRVTGNHPEYPSGHACFTGAVTESLRNYFGTKEVRLEITSLATGAGPMRTYENLDELVTDVENARVWGGLHYRTTMTDTAKDFPRIARDIGKRYFLVKDKDD
ncbi:MAG: vanadium-dependent haloperoxidase [Gaiellaceae bacterium]